ncbi:hypothetical protein [Marinilactibacillus psychrotolerans]|uniref:Uncharacterized protein n=1 Tax=Marinilactibacillus psychrotolerans TaxID=191770 RepID=A0AAV3W9G2_9LACT|nr:hypothetical protein [Marinilactibacillus psychrotolerans]GEL67267.1 hypothetical protein MPS01_14220 [Marinilactibacillus psychrotolerans]GEQ36071.1 hypothetical protein M132T_15790 [Marinilactibacillus psychrotolerans]SDC62385.1 hypothetical protein SAMN04488013_10782 [Marinilactibacillus psychrotolerans]
MEDDNTITDDDIWGLGESSLILMENEIEELLKEPTDERRSETINPGQNGI